MKIITYLSKQWTLRGRDWLIATVQGAFAAGADMVIAHFNSDLDYHSILRSFGIGVALFLFHAIRKAGEPTKHVTIKSASGDGDNPPNNNDPTHPPKPPKKPVE